MLEQSLIQEYHKQYTQELMNSCIPFWLNYSKDSENGGIFNSITQDGRVYATDKSIWLQGRCAWLFSHLCKIYGERPEWKEMAQSCLNFLTEHGVDPEDGRMYFSTTADGKPLRKRRYFFSETFFIMACAEYACAFGEAKYMDLARKYYAMVMDIFNDPATDPYKITPKGIPSTRETIAFAPPMILLNVSHVMEENDPENSALYQKNAAMLTEYIRTNFIKPDLKVLLECVGADGSFLPEATGCRTMNPGHTIEGAWFLLNQAEKTGDEALVKLVEDLFKWSVDIGWDEEFGGIRAFVDVLGYPPEALEHDMKLWWPTCELLICSLLLYKHTKNPYYWDWFVKADKYASDHFRDAEYGEWFGYLNREGKPTMPACKGCLFKGPFHVPRMLFMVERALNELVNEA